MANKKLFDKQVKPYNGISNIQRQYSSFAFAAPQEGERGWESCREMFCRTYARTTDDYKKSAKRFFIRAPLKRINRLENVPRVIRRLERLIGIAVGKQSKFYKVKYSRESTERIYDSSYYPSIRTKKVLLQKDDPRLHSVIAVDPAKFWGKKHLLFSFFTAIIKAVLMECTLKVPPLDCTDKQMWKYLKGTRYFKPTEYATKRFLRGYTEVKYRMRRKPSDTLRAGWVEVFKINKKRTRKQVNKILHK